MRAICQPVGNTVAMIRRIVPLATVLLLFAGASSTACSSRKSGDKTQPSASPSAKIPSAEELKNGLLALADMPTGYSAGTPKTANSPAPDNSTSLGAPNAECERLFNQFDEGSAGEQGQATIEFRKSATGPFIRHTLESYRDAAALRASLMKIREAVDKCGEFSVGDADGQAKVKIAAASFPKLGDDTAAFQLEATVTTEGRRVPVGGYLVAVRIGNVVSTIISFGVPKSDAAETEQIARKAVDKATPIAR